MTMLTYTLLTDPAPLQASAPGRSPSTGTVYLIVTNTGQSAAYWSTITVEVPIGDGAGHLTPDITTITAKGEYNGTQPITVQRQGSTAFRATAAAGGRTRPFAVGDYLVLMLENVTVAAGAGLAVLRVTEATSRSANVKPRNSVAMVALVKTAAKAIPAPRDFRPDSAMVDAGTNITLRWEGSADFTYEIMYSGAPQPVPVSVGTWVPPDAPKRATTYILIATDPNTQQKHYLTTTVQVRNPVLETLTATTGIDTPWVQGATDATKGRVTFTGTGAEISNSSGGQGTVFADKADLNGVNTKWVQGRSTDDGWISFPKEGLNVRRGAGQDWGTVFADKADLNGVNTKWVQGRSTDDGWISFPHFGVQVSRGGTDTATQGVVYTDSIRAKDVPGMTGGGWINLHNEGITVYAEKDGSNELGNVTARSYNR